MDPTKARELATLFFNSLKQASGNHWLLNGQIDSAASAFANNAELTIDLLKSNPTALQLIRDMAAEAVRI